MKIYPYAQLEHARRVATCPVCKVAPGESCIERRYGNRTRVAHDGRVKAAARTATGTATKAGETT